MCSLPDPATIFYVEAGFVVHNERRLTRQEQDVELQDIKENIYRAYGPGLVPVPGQLASIQFTILERQLARASQNFMGE